MLSFEKLREMFASAMSNEVVVNPFRGFSVSYGDELGIDVLSYAVRQYGVRSWDGKVSKHTIRFKSPISTDFDAYLNAWEKQMVVGIEIDYHGNIGVILEDGTVHRQRSGFFAVKQQVFDAIMESLA